MLRKLDRSQGKVLGYDLDGRMTTEDVERVHSDLRAVIREQGAARFLMDVRDLESAEPRAIVEDLKLTPEYLKDVERYAVIGDARWQERLTQATDFLTRGDARYFPPDQIEQAWDWIAR
jgi:hypothetical protein